jgi:hypothetical protein
MALVHLFFATSQGVTDRLGELFNFVWANTVAMWTLRDQVGRFIAETGSRTEEELAARFVKPSGVTSADLRTTCLKWTWEQQQEQFAKILLFELCGLYEAWLEDVVVRAMPRGTPDKDLDRIQKGLQYPSGVNNKNQPQGFGSAIATVNQHKSVVMTKEFFPVLKAHRKNSWNEMEPMLKAYRYFKECRNKLIHTGGIATKELVTAYAEIAPIDPKNLHLRGPLRLPSVKEGQCISIALPDVVALSNIIHHIIITLDAALSVTQGSEEDLLERIKKVFPKGNKLPTADVGRREGRIRSLVRKAGVPEPLRVALLEKLLVDRFGV